MSETVRTATAAEVRESLLRSLPKDVREALDAYMEVRARVEQLVVDHQSLRARTEQSAQNLATARQEEERAWAAWMRLREGGRGAMSAEQCWRRGVFFAVRARGFADRFEVWNKYSDDLGSVALGKEMADLRALLDDIEKAGADETWRVATVSRTGEEALDE